jgi:UDP-N-acetylmuramoyl-L-alanyl-D-glutamate--2,6-diaminopimelate ligase
MPGALFLAIPGVVADGHHFVASAVSAGAIAVVAQDPVTTSVPVVLVRDVRRAAEVLAAAWYHEPAHALKLVGITGTNGKTTTTALVRHLLDTGGDAGSIGTLGAFDGSGRAVTSTAGSLTTPGPVDLQATLRGLVDRGVKWVAMEASSHALDQHRLDGLSYVAGVFTNLTREHLDYHETMDRYRAAKLLLANLVKQDGVLSVNAEDAAWSVLSTDPRTIRWGTSADADVRVSDVHILASGSMFTIDGRFGRAEVRLPLPGDFNIANAIAAATVALGLGRSMAEVVERLDRAPQVPGRMERIIDAPFHVMRDYAHTPDAMERLLATLRPITPGRIILVFGCGGDRDRGKRSQMGTIAAKGADVTLLTSDNPRTEDPEQILDDIASGMPPKSYQREPDRHLAIATALGSARPGDVVVLAGKGHETYQITGAHKEDFDERGIVLGLMGR